MKALFSIFHITAINTSNKPRSITEVDPMLFPAKRREGMNVILLVAMIGGVASCSGRKDRSSDSLTLAASNQTQPLQSIFSCTGKGVTSELVLSDDSLSFLSFKADNASGILGDPQESQRHYVHQARKYGDTVDIYVDKNMLTPADRKMLIKKDGKVDVQIEYERGDSLMTTYTCEFVREMVGPPATVPCKDSVPLSSNPTVRYSKMANGTVVTWQQDSRHGGWQDPTGLTWTDNCRADGARLPTFEEFARLRTYMCYDKSNVPYGVARSGEILTHGYSPVVLEFLAYLKPGEHIGPMFDWSDHLFQAQVEATSEGGSNTYYFDGKTGQLGNYRTSYPGRIKTRDLCVTDSKADLPPGPPHNG